MDNEGTVIPAAQFDSLPQNPSAQGQQGTVVPAADFDSLQDNNEKYGTTGQQVIAGVEGAAQGIAGPLAPLAETALGVPGEDIRGRAEANPWTHGLAEAGGFAAGAFMGTSEASLLAHAGEGAQALVGLGEASNAAHAAYEAAMAAGKTEAFATSAARAAYSATSSGMSISAKLAKGAVGLGTEMALMQAGDETTKLITGDPNQTVGSAAANIGLSGLLGAATGVIGSGLGQVGASGLSKFPSAENFLQDMKDRMIYRAANISPKEAIQNDLSETMSYLDETAGKTFGVRKDAFEKILNPEAEANDLTAGPGKDVANVPGGELAEAPSAEQLAQENISRELLEKFSKAREKLESLKVPQNLVGKFENAAQTLVSTLSDPASSPIAKFNAINGMKSDLQDFSKGNWGPFAVPTYSPEHDFLQVTKGLGRDLRLALENPDVWGEEVSNLQKGLNSAWHELDPLAKQIKGKFMAKVGNEFEVDPAKIGTYFNQAGKSESDTIKQQIMGKFVDAMENYQKAVSDVHVKAGIEPPKIPSMNSLRESLGKSSVGSRMADAIYDKLAAKTLGTSIGGGLGGAIGHAIPIPGAGWAGAALGGRLGETVLPSFLQPVIEKVAHHAAFSEAANFGVNALKGNNALKNAAKNIFSGLETVPQHLMPTDRKIEKLDNQAKEIQVQPTKMFNVAGNLGYYMPNHAQALSQTTMNAVNFLNSKRPQPKQMGPLDSPIPPSKMAEQAYQRTLAIAQQPLVALKYLQEGKLQPQDVVTLKSLYPNFYTKMAQQVTGSMMDHLAKGEKIPYKLRQGLSMFVGQPLDSTMTPQSIQSAQMAFAPPVSTPPDQPVQKNKRNTSKLGEVAQSEFTKNQRAQQGQMKA